MPASKYRTDRHSNPVAFTTEVAAQALKLGVDYVAGDPFKVGNKTYYTAKLLGDPVKLTIQLIDKIGFRTKNGKGDQRWIHTVMPKFVWDYLSTEIKRGVIGSMYHHEGGTAMKDLFVGSPKE